MKEPFDMASKLLDVHGINGARAEPECITIVHAPDERHVESFPSESIGRVITTILGTDWQFEGKPTGEYCERHSWSGGITNAPVLPARKAPAGYELQKRLVK